MLSSLKDFLNYYILRPLSRIRPGLGRLFAFCLGSLEDLTNKEIPRVAEAINEISNGFFSKEQSRKIARKWIITRFYNWVDGFAILGHPPEKIKETYAIKNLEEMEQAFTRGKGIILATFHIGCYELIGYRLMVEFGEKLSALATNPLQEGMGSIKKKIVKTVVQTRNESLEIIPVPSSTAVRKTIKCLKNNGMYYLAVDHFEGAEKLIKANLFGTPIYFPRGCVQLAKKTGATVIPIAAIRQPNQTHDIIFFKGVQFDPSDDTVEGMEKTFQKIVSQLEEVIKQNPHLLITWRDMQQLRSLHKEYERGIKE